MTADGVHLLRAAAWLLPDGPVKKLLLRRLGHVIDPTARARPCVVWKVDAFRLGAHGRLGPFNVFKNLRSVIIDDDASVGRHNLFSSHPVYQRLYPDGASFHLGAHAIVSNRHQLDCAGSVSVGPFAALGGSGSTVLTHSVDLRTDAQVAHPVRVGARSFVGTHCVLLGGATVPDRSVVAAGSVVTRAMTERPGLWAGVPARWRADFSGRWLERSATDTHRVYIPATDTTVEDAF